MKRFLLYHFPALLYAGIIFTLSSMPRSEIPDFSILQADKLLHFAEYAIFAVLIFRSMSDLLGRKGFRHIMWVSLVIVMIFAAADEFYQRYIPGRHSDVIDLVLDFIGATLILLLLWYRKKTELSQQ